MLRRRRREGRRWKNLLWSCSVLLVVLTCHRLSLLADCGSAHTTSAQPSRHLLGLSQENSTSSDDSDSLYPANAFSKDEMRRGAFLVFAAGVLYMFFALAIVCDTYFVPALEGLSEKLNLSEDVSGATFMAAGGSAPEFFTSLLGVFVAKSNVGFGTIVGSAVFNVLFVIGACSIATYTAAGGIGGGLPLTWWPLLRDSAFYTVDLVILVVFFRDKHIDWYESLILLLCYAAYVTFMAHNEGAYQWLLKRLGRRVAPESELVEVAVCPASATPAPEPQPSPDLLASSRHSASKRALSRDLRRESRRQKASGVEGEEGFPTEVIKVRSMSDEPSSTLTKSLEEMADVAVEEGSSRSCSNSSSEGDGDADGWSPQPPDGGAIDLAIFVALFPLNFLLWLTLPDCSDPAKRTQPKYFVWGFAGSIVWIAFFSFFMVWWSEEIGDALGIPPEVMGLTLLAAGTSVPDLLTSVMVARKGFGDMAVSSSIGSNIFDVTFGLPVPWFLYSIAHGGEAISVDSNSLGSSIILLLAMVAATIAAIALFKWKLNVLLGAVSLVLYTIFVTVTLLIEYKVLGGFSL
eukprot:Sspe_Gene.45188::Locus_22332_Transcript_1_1_Confidence_1.000_Length_2268::g.45188::m.45188/K13750/SLC24A2, NCKX2; solute carrier family 24 (sodium/potassium/calcium exchanger), member 2